MKKNSRLGATGFIAIVITIIGVVGFVGWRLYGSNNTKNQSQSTAQASSGTAATDQATAQYIDIKELGIKMSLSDDINDLTYSAQTLSDGSKAATFSTKALTAIDQNCDAASGILGSIEMTTVDSDRTGAKRIVDNTGIFKLGEYYISYSSPQALCSDKVSGLTGGLRASLRSALKTMQFDY